MKRNIRDLKVGDKLKFLAGDVFGGVKPGEIITIAQVVPGSWTNIWAITSKFPIGRCYCHDDLNEYKVKLVND